MRFIYINVYQYDHAVWDFSERKETPFESVCIAINFHFNLTKKEVLALSNDILLRESPAWFLSGGHKWTIDLDQLKRTVDACSDLEWLIGKIIVEPEYKYEQRPLSDRIEYTSTLVVTLMPEDLSRELFQMHTIKTDEPLPSLSYFQKDYPILGKNGFVIMQFSETKAHQEILNSIRSTLRKHSLAGLRADDKEYSDDLFTNIRTYMHGCGFAIAVFERLLADDFNPNISLEVGYMIAQGKPVFFLKDQTLKSLQTDLVGKLYRNFDPQHPGKTIPIQLEGWLRDKGLI